jgi:peptide chain release factor subunit 1
MPLEELLQRLVKEGPKTKYFLSAYLDLRPDPNGKKTFPVFLKSRFTELESRFPPHAPEHSFFVRDSKQIQKYLEEKLDPSWKGIAFFACAPDEFFLSVPMPLPPVNKVEVAPCPRLFSLLRISDLYRSYGIVVADSRQARLFLIRLSRLEKQLTLSWEDTHSTRFGRMGLSTQRFQRHQKEHIKQRAKEIVETMEKWITQEKAEYLFLAAEEEMSGELEKQWSAATVKKLVPLPPMDAHDPDHKILAAASAHLQAITRKKAEALAQNILEEAAPLRQAAVGPEPTISALQNHQVDRLILDSQFEASGWSCEGCARLGSGGTPMNCPVCGAKIRAAELHEEIVCKANSQGVPLLFTHRFPSLLTAGGIAAMLKYKMTPKTAP